MKASLKLANPGMRFLITGGSGFLGSRLCELLIEDGHHVSVLTRNIARARKRLPEPIRLVESFKHINDEEHFDVIINLAGESIVTSRWTKYRKRMIYQSRVKMTERLVRLIERLQHKPRVLISGSAVGYYGISDDQKLTEKASPQTIFMSELCHAWENEALKAKKYGVRVCLLRTGLVLSKRGGLLSKMLPAFKYYLGGELGSGQQWLSWIHVNDWLGITEKLINDNNLSGAFNATAPHPETNRAYTQMLAKQLHRPHFFTLPRWLIKLLLGEMGEQLLLSGQRVIPKNIMDSGYEFEFATLESAFADLLGEEK